MHYLLILLILLTSLPAKADAPVIWFGLWAKSLTSNGLEARGLKLDKDATASTPWTLVIPSPALVTSWTMTLPLNAGTANYVLRSDGLGVTSWEDPATLIAGTPNTFAGFDSSSILGSIPNWIYDPVTFGADVQLTVIPTDAEGYLNLHTFRQSVNPTSSITGSTWSIAQMEINVGTDDSGFSYSADGSGGVTGLQLSVNSRNKSSVGNIRQLNASTQIGDGVDPVASQSFQGIYSNLYLPTNATANTQTQSFSADVGVDAGATIDNYSWGNGNLNSTGTINNLSGLNLSGNVPTLTSYLNGANLNYNIGSAQGVNGFNSNISVTGTLTNGYQSFAAFGTLANTNGIATYGDYLSVTNENNNYSSFRANPTITSAGSYSALSAVPNITTITSNVNMIDTAGSGTSPNWTDVNIHPNLTLVTDGYKGINATPVAVGDGSGYATVGYFDASQLTNFSAGQVLALQTQGDAQVNGKFNAFAGITPIDQGGNPNAIHGIISSITTTPSATTANVDTIGVNTASLMNISTNSINTSGPFGLGLAALALPAVLKTETGSSIDYVNAAVFAVQLDATSSGGTVDELTGGRFVVIPQGGTHTINKIKLVKAELPFGDPATMSWGFYGSSTTSENWFAKNIKIGGTAGSTDFVSDAASVLQVEGGSIDVLNGQLKTSTANSNIYVTPNGSGCISAQIPDSTSAGGNPRGTYCIDLQTFRSNADEVSSANVSIVMGAQNKASADFSMALGGANNYATAQKAVTLGGTDNTAAHDGAYVFGNGGLSQTAGDLIFSSGGAPSSEANNYFRLAGDTHSVHIGVYDDTGADNFDNALLLHGRNTGTQSKYIGLKAPDSVTTSTTFTLPNGDGTSGQVLQTNGSAALSWVSTSTVPVTAGGVYSDGSALQTVPFAANANKLFGVNSGATSMEAKDIVTGTTGTDFNVAHTAGTITLNLPDASSSARGAVTTGNQTLAGTKTFDSGALISNGSVTGPSLGLATDQDGTGTGLYRVGLNSLGFAANGVQAGKYDEDGGWTFGPSTYTERHRVNGAIDFTSDTAYASGMNLGFNSNTLRLWGGSSGGTIVNTANSANLLSWTNTGAFTVGDPTNAAFEGNNIVGRKDGSSLASGYVGEIIRVAPVSATHLSTQIANAGIGLSSGTTTTNYLLYKSSTVGDAVKLSLTPGVWEVDAGCEFLDTANPSTSTLLQFYVGTTTTASSITNNGDNRWVTRALKETGTNGTSVSPRVSTTISTASNQDVYLYTLFQGTVTASWSFESCWFVGKRIS